MTSPELRRLEGIGKLTRGKASAGEIEGLRSSGEARLEDAKNPEVSLEGRFDLAYNAAHALSLAALRRLGYRTDQRYVVFQALPHTLGIATEQWRVLAKAHELRNRAEYEGILDVDERLVADMIDAATVVRDALREAGPMPDNPT